MSIEQDIASTKVVVARHRARAAFARLGIFAAILSVVFLKPLIGWVQLALDSDTFSYVILIPVLVVYLVRQQWKPRVCDPANEAESATVNEDMIRGESLQGPSSHGVRPAVCCWAVALGLLTVYWFVRRGGWDPTPETRVALIISAYYVALLGGGFLCLGVPRMRALSFPAAFLAFMIPFPTIMTNGIEIFFQHASAEVSHWFFMWSGTPILRDGLSFKIPGITLRVAQECSGIRSSLVLFICSLLAGQMFLKTRWRRIFLTVFVIPLAIIRNGIRILTIGLLCVHIGPEMIESVVHKRGGPFFFALSLIPFFLVLWWLVLSERKAGRR